MDIQKKKLKNIYKMTNFYNEQELENASEWRLHIVLPSADFSEEYKTLREMMNDGWRVVRELEEDVYMLNPYTGLTEAFYIDKTPMEE